MGTSVKDGLRIPYRKPARPHPRNHCHFKGAFFATVSIGNNSAAGMPALSPNRHLRAAIYARVSTGSQTTENQLRELRQVAERHGWTVDAEFLDNGISGAKGRDRRPGLDKLLQAVARREIDMVMAWSVDSTRPLMQNLVEFLGELHGKRVDLYLHQQGSTPPRRQARPCSR
jgi:Resolvase, N terminal domain